MANIHTTVSPCKSSWLPIPLELLLRHPSLPLLLSRCVGCVADHVLLTLGVFLKLTLDCFFTFACPSYVCVQSPPAASQDSTSTAPATQSSTTGVASSCLLELPTNSGPQTFSGCTQISTVGNDFHVMWNSEPLASDPTVSLALIMRWFWCMEGQCAI